MIYKKVSSFFFKFNLLEGSGRQDFDDVCSSCCCQWNAAAWDTRMRNLKALCQKLKTVDKKTCNFEETRVRIYCTRSVLSEVRRQSRFTDSPQRHHFRHCQFVILTPYALRSYSRPHRHCQLLRYNTFKLLAVWELQVPAYPCISPGSKLARYV